MKHLPLPLIHLIDNQYTFEMMIGEFLTMFKPFRRTGFYPRIMRLPEGHGIYVDDPSTILINIADLYLVDEYSSHGDYAPKSGWTIIDAGAHVGLFTLRASKLVGETGLVIAFEPNPITFYWMTQNLALNKTKNVRAYPIALGGDQSTSWLSLIASGNPGSSSLKEKATTPSNKKYSIRTLVRRLDDFARTQLDRTVVNLLKVDVEGSELDVLEGAHGLMNSRSIERLIVEIHLQVVSREDVIRFLSKYSYKVDFSDEYGPVKEVIFARLPEIKGTSRMTLGGSNDETN